jgi:predicted lipid-binding transport protein (Tim44 family)
MSEGGFQFLDIILLGAVAGFIVLRLRSVLGQRSGHEQQRRRRFGGPEAGPNETSDEGPDEGKVITLPRRDQPAGPTGDVRIDRIRAADPRFDAAEFIAGAKAAYEMIVTAFAAGDKDALRPLLSREVFGDFAGAIDERARRGETMETTVVGLRGAEITDTQVNGRIAEVTVTFRSELMNAVRDAQGHVVGGHANKVEDVTDVWTFARDAGSRDPNWTLIATSAPAAPDAPV